MNEQHRKNLKTLADYLLALPVDYYNFGMADYAGGHEKSMTPEEVFNANHCGTSGCAVGHAPLVDELPSPSKGENWDCYCFRVFGVGDEDLDTTNAWNFMFGSTWSDEDDTAEGAAQRILEFLDSGVPNNFYDY